MGFSPSTRAKTSPSLLTFAVTVEFLVGRKTTALLLREWGEMGVMTIPSMDGSSTGPPAESEWAVDPLGVAENQSVGRIINRPNGRLL